MAEYFEVVDENDRVIRKATRVECHSNKNLIHRGVTILVLNSSGHVLLEKRSMKKDLYPGYWGLVAGHVSPRESYKEAARREMAEEIGTKCELRLLFKTLLRMTEETEMEAVFSCTHEGPFKVNREESDEVRFFPKEEVMKMLDAGKIPDGDARILARFFKIKQP